MHYSIKASKLMMLIYFKVFCYKYALGGGLLLLLLSMDGSWISGLIWVELIIMTTGLQRCGKSCRLRWINYLRPDLKRGTFSSMEENRIIELHAILGNRYQPFISTYYLHISSSFFSRLNPAPIPCVCVFRHSSPPFVLNYASDFRSLMILFIILALGFISVSLRKVRWALRIGGLTFNIYVSLII